MFKTILSFLILLSFHYSSLGDCPSRADIQLRYQQAVKANQSQKALLTLKKICLQCHYQDSIYVQILENIAENYGNQEDYHNAILNTNEAININKLFNTIASKVFLEKNYYKLGNFFDELGNSEEALKAYDLGINVAKKNLSIQKYLFHL